MGFLAFLAVKYLYDFRILDYLVFFAANLISYF